MPAIAAKPAVLIDYPAQNEEISSPEYTIRVGVLQDVQSVDVSINDSAWQPCRAAAGYWWYDWSGYLPGRHEISARAVMRGGRTITSEPRSARVSPNGAPARAPRPRVLSK